jgi:hypothetical protein
MGRRGRSGDFARVLRDSGPRSDGVRRRARSYTASQEVSRRGGSIMAAALGTADVLRAIFVIFPALLLQCGWGSCGLHEGTKRGCRRPVSRRRPRARNCQSRPSTPSAPPMAPGTQALITSFCAPWCGMLRIPPFCPTRRDLHLRVVVSRRVLLGPSGAPWDGATAALHHLSPPAALGRQLRRCQSSAGACDGYLSSFSLPSPPPSP